MGRRQTTKSSKNLRLAARRQKRIPPHVHAAKRRRLQQLDSPTRSTTISPAGESSCPDIGDTSVSMEQFIPNTTSTPFQKGKAVYSYKRKRIVPPQLMKWRMTKMRKTIDIGSNLSLPSTSSDSYEISTPSVSISSHNNLISNENDLTTVPHEISSAPVNSINTEDVLVDDILAREYNELIIESDGRPPKDNVEMITGRFIIDGKHFVKEIRSLDNHRFECEQNSNGYMSLVSSHTKSLEWNLKFMCPYCKQIKIINSEPHNADPEADSPQVSSTPLSLADQAVWGFSSIGSGHRNMEEVLSSMNVAPISDKLFRKTEERLGQIWQDVLFESMIQAGMEEKKLAIEKGNVTKNNVPFISVVVDGGWSHRSHGHRYSANSGVACVIGLQTKKLLHIDVRNKYCSMCKYLEKKGKPTTHRNCFKNWDGSSCSMEPDMIVDAFNASEKLHGIQYRRMVGDGDSSVHHKIREMVTYGRFVEKIECTNHLIKNYTKRLFKMRESGIAEKRILNLTTIKRLKAAARGAIIHHSEEKNIKELKEDLKNSPLHVLGYHVGCKPYFCQKIGTGEIPEGQTYIVQKRILEALKPLIFRAGSLWENQTSNLAENYMSLVAKFTGGKQINRGKRGSFTFRTRAAALDFQYGPMWHHKAMKSVLKKSPALLVKKTCLRREKRVLSCKRSLLKKGATKPTQQVKPMKQHTGAEDYGELCKKLDIDENDFEEERNALLNSLNFSEKEKAQLEVKTRGQRENPIWLEERKLRLTASNFGLVCKRLPKSKWAPVVKCILYSKAATSAMLYGEINESTAIASFEKKMKKVVLPCGLFVDKIHSFLAASPDGLVGDDCIIEVKCPKSAENLTIKEAIQGKKNFYLSVDKTSGDVRLKTTHNYYYQIQGQLHITRRKKCYFVVWTKKDLHIEEIEQNETFWKEKMEEKLVYFFKFALLPEIIDPRTCRSLPIREPTTTLAEFAAKQDGVDTDK